jgi:hypothetical protein
MYPSGNEPSSVQVPDAPPLVILARLGNELCVTVLHAAAADLFWQIRQQLLEIHGCYSLRLIILTPAPGNGAIKEIQWRRPVVPDRRVSWKRR